MPSVVMCPSFQTLIWTRLWYCECWLRLSFLTIHVKRFFRCRATRNHDLMGRIWTFTCTGRWEWWERQLIKCIFEGFNRSRWVIEVKRLHSSLHIRIWYFKNKPHKNLVMHDLFLLFPLLSYSFHLLSLIWFHTSDASETLPALPLRPHQTFDSYRTPTSSSQSWHIQRLSYDPHILKCWHIWQYRLALFKQWFLIDPSLSCGITRKHLASVFLTDWSIFDKLDVYKAYFWALAIRRHG